MKGAPRFLLSEALRGEGAYLRNESGDRFMERYHPLKELAPRDVVSRAIVTEIRRTGTEHAYLDLTHLDVAKLPARYPRIYETCLRYGIDLTKQPVPVHPAAHYAMGGVQTDLEGRTTLPRLFAAGEAACTGVHGANRLASNSLLEGVVFGARAGRVMRESVGGHAKLADPGPVLFPNTTEADVRTLAWDQCGIVRQASGLTTALRMLQAGSDPKNSADRSAYELRNIHTVVSLIARAALAREESRGGHYRLDFPEKREVFQKHSLASINHAVRFI